MDRYKRAHHDIIICSVAEVEKNLPGLNGFETITEPLYKTLHPHLSDS